MCTRIRRGTSDGVAEPTLKAIHSMSNPGVQTTQMLANLSTFMSNVGEGNLHDSVTPVIQNMIAKLGREMNAPE